MLETKSPTNAASDVITILYLKSRIFEDYQRCLDDVRGDTRLTQLIVQMRHDDERHIKLLRAHLARLLAAENTSPVA
jgi:hypothetical protein